MSRKKKREVFYTMLCGCVRKKEELVVRLYRSYCPEHNQGIQSKFAYCEDCGAEIRYFVLTSQIPWKCNQCKPPTRRRAVPSPKKHLSNKRKKLKRRHVSMEEFIDLMMEKADCKYRPLCAEVHIKQEELPCIDCPDYEPKGNFQELKYDIDLKKMDKFIKAGRDKEGRMEWGELYEKRQRDLNGSRGKKAS